eukprot:4799315-Prymnesium_polylepis.1
MIVHPCPTPLLTQQKNLTPRTDHCSGPYRYAPRRVRSLLSAFKSACVQMACISSDLSWREAVSGMLRNKFWANICVYIQTCAKHVFIFQKLLPPSFLAGACSAPARTREAAMCGGGLWGRSMNIRSR